MPIVLSNEEKLAILRRRKEVLRQSYGETVLTIELWENTPDGTATPEYADALITKSRIEENDAYIDAQIEALEDATIDAGVDDLAKAAAARGRRSKPAG